MAVISSIANLELGGDVRAKLNEVIARVNGLSPLSALQVGTATDYLHVGADGQLRLIGAAKVWDDLDFAMTIRTGAGTNPPVWTQLGTTGLYGWAFENGDEAWFQRQIPHRYREWQPAWKPHVHWISTTSASYVGTWTMTLTWRDATPPGINVHDGAYGYTVITRRGSFSTMAQAGDSLTTALEFDGDISAPVINGEGWGISTLLFAKLTLTLTSGASCLLSGFDLHGEIDSLGSALETSKDPE